MLMHDFADAGCGVQRVSPAASITPYLLANFAHEVRTPLNAILGFSRLLEQRPDRADYAQAIGLAGQRLELALAGFMNWLRLVSDPASLTPVQTTVAEIVGAAAQTVSGCMTAQGVRLETCGLADITIQADTHYLSSALAAAIGGILPSLGTGGALRIGAATADDGTALWLEWHAEPAAFAAVRHVLSEGDTLAESELVRKDAPNIELRIARLLIEAQGGSVDLAADDGAARLRFRLKAEQTA